VVNLSALAKELAKSDPIPEQPVVLQPKTLKFERKALLLPSNFVNKMRRNTNPDISPEDSMENIR